MSLDPNSMNNDETKIADELLDDKEIQEKIELTPEQYVALLDKIKALEENQKRGGKQYDLDELVAEAKSAKADPSKKARPPEKNLDDMTRLELAQYIVNVIGEHFTPVASDLQVQIQTIKLSQEIDRCASKHDDFWDLHEEIIRIGSENPSLSIEKAYKLAKAERGETANDKSDKKEKTLLTLPPKPVLGEKPNTPSRKSTVPKVMTLEEAAERAWADVGEKKE